MPIESPITLMFTAPYVCDKRDLYCLTWILALSPKVTWLRSLVMLYSLVPHEVAPLIRSRSIANSGSKWLHVFNPNTFKLAHLLWKSVRDIGIWILQLPHASRIKTISICSVHDPFYHHNTLHSIPLPHNLTAVIKKQIL